MAASRSRRLPTVVLAGVAGVVGIGGDGVGMALGVLSLAVAFLVAFPSRRERLLGGLVGLVAGQALLRGPSYGFTGLPTLVAVAVVVPVLVSAWRIARTHERKVVGRLLIGLGAIVLIGGLTAGAATYEARRHLENAADQAESGLEQLRDGDTEAAADTFSKAQFEFEKASSSLSGPLGLVGRAVPIVAPNLGALRKVSASGEDLGFTASQAASQANWRDLTAQDGQVDLEKVRSMQDPIARSSAALDAALATVADVRSPWLLPPLDTQLDRFEEEIVGAADEASIASEALAVVPDLLGAEGPTRYFVAFSTPGESRNAGGFAGAFAFLEADDGRLRVDRTGSTMRGLLPAEGGGFQLDLTPEWTEIYGSYDVASFPGNLTASPDWPTDAAVAAQLGAQAMGGGPVNGVIYADPAALAALLELTGPVQVEGVAESLTADNVEQFLLVDQYLRFGGESAERNDVLGEVAKAVFDALLRRPLPGIQDLADTLGPVVSGGHLRVAVVDDPRGEALLERVGLSGSFGSVAGADVISLRSSNLIASKIDAYLRREVTLSVSLDPLTGEVTTFVDAVLSNDAPDTGLPAYIIGSGAEVPKGTNRDLLTLYSPLQISTVEVNGVPSPVQTHRELGLNTYGVVVDIPSGGEVRVRFQLSGPPPGRLTDTDTYELLVVPQPLARPDDWKVVIQSDGDELGSFTGPLLETLKFAVRPAD